MQIHDFLHIGQSETESLHIMHITSMNTIELIEDFLQILLLHTQSGISYREIKMFFIIPGFHRNVEWLIRFAIFHRIIHQIEDYILEMYLIYIEPRINRFNIGIYLTPRMLNTECK